MDTLFVAEVIKNSVVVQDTGTVHQKGCTQWCSVKRDTFRTEL